MGSHSPCHVAAGSRRISPVELEFPLTHPIWLINWHKPLTEYNTLWAGMHSIAILKYDALACLSPRVKLKVNFGMDRNYKEE